MFSKNNAFRRHQNHPAESANSAKELVFNEDGAETNEPIAEDQCWEAPCAEVEHPSKFIKGITIALPLSISLWASILIGLRAFF